MTTHSKIVACVKSKDSSAYRAIFKTKGKSFPAMIRVEGKVLRRENLVVSSNL